MSKNLTRKGLAFGALVALAASAFTGAPASADTTGPVTLVPNAGTTFNSILQSGITLKSEIDPNASVDTTDLSFLITNAGEADIKLDFDNSGNAGDSIDAIEQATAPDGTVLSTAVKNSTTVFNKKYIYLNGSGTNLGDFSGNTLQISTTETEENVVLKVRAWTDADGDGVVDTFELSSDEETVTLYALANVSATTSLTEVAVSSDKYKGTVVFSNDINPFAVAARTYAKVIKNGTQVALKSGGASTDASTDFVGTSASTTAVDAAGGLYALAKNTLTFGSITGGDNRLDAVAEAGFYTAQALYDTKASAAKSSATGVYSVGAPSAAQDLTAGASADVDGVTVDVTDTADVKKSGNDALIVRATTKTVQITAQLTDASIDLEASNVPIKAVLAEGSLDATSSVTISGSSETLKKDGAAITGNLRSNSSGKAVFTITSTTGKSADAVDLTVYAKTSTGTWVAAAKVDIDWQLGTFTEFSVKGGNYVAGAKPSVTVQALDQFGQGIDAISGKKLYVYGLAAIGGIEDSTKYSDTINLSSGKATFTFTNFAAVNSTAQLVVRLYQTSTSPTAIETEYVTVYNAPATDRISIADSFKADVTYKDFVTGDKSDSATAKKISDAGITAGGTLSGTVINVNNAGQTGMTVTIYFPGALLIDGDTYATNTITTKTNEYGYFDVDFAVHTVNTKGATVTVTADGKTATTKVKSYLPVEGLNGNNLAFSWVLPAFVVKDTTYLAKLKLTDKWGNAVKATGQVAADAAVEVTASGALQVNGKETVNKNFGKDGSITIYLRSFSKIAGPGALDATLQVSSYATSNDAIDGSLDAVDLDTIATDVTTTVWDETAYSDVLETEFVVLDAKPTASITKATTSTVVVKNANTTTIKVVRGTKSKTVVATSNRQKVSLKGGTGAVKVYVNGLKIASK